MKPHFPDIIILAGGFGTRLQSVVKDLPKPMAPIANKPFLEWLMNYLLLFNPRKFILSTGYKHEVIETYFGSSFKNIPLEYCIEKEPLGTGGAIKKALTFTNSEDILVLNGDTFFQLDHGAFYKSHLSSKSLFSMALKPMEKPYRYGTVEFKNQVITNFNEKNPELESGFINTGVYLVSKNILPHLPSEDTFSFETNFLETSFQKINMHSFVANEYFIDIGIPDDYAKANNEFPDLFNTK